MKASITLGLLAFALSNIPSSDAAEKLLHCRGYYKGSIYGERTNSFLSEDLDPVPSQGGTMDFYARFDFAALAQYADPAAAPTPGTSVIVFTPTDSRGKVSPGVKSPLSLEIARAYPTYRLHNPSPVATSHYSYSIPQYSVGMEISIAADAVKGTVIVNRIIFEANDFLSVINTIYCE